MHHCPESLKRNIVNRYGNFGKKWLEAIPSRLLKLADIWQLSEFSPVKDMSWHYVSKAKSAQFGVVVLKLGCDKAVMQEELSAYQHFKHCGLMTLYDYDTSHGALLMQQATPGYSMHSAYLSDIHGSIQAYCQLVHRLKDVSPPEQTRVKTINDWLQAVKRAEPSSLPAGYHKKAVSLIQTHQHIKQELYVIHGDLHQENILYHDDTWTAIDPKGIIGHRLFEAAGFDYAHQSELSSSNIKPIFQNRVQIMAEALQLQEPHLYHWILIRLILASCWMIEDNGDPQQFLQYISPLFGETFSDL